jgi:hypothetical protein
MSMQRIIADVNELLKRVAKLEQQLAKKPAAKIATPPAPKKLR